MVEVFQGRPVVPVLPEADPALPVLGDGLLPAEPSRGAGVPPGRGPPARGGHVARHAVLQGRGMSHLRFTRTSPLIRS
jgi:hypothetical protein